MNFCQKDLKPVNKRVLKEKKIYLGDKNKGKKTLVFDMDETLIHCNNSSNSDVTIPITFPTGDTI